MRADEQGTGERTRAIADRRGVEAAAERTRRERVGEAIVGEGVLAGRDEGPMDWVGRVVGLEGERDETRRVVSVRLGPPLSLKTVRFKDAKKSEQTCREPRDRVTLPSRHLSVIVLPWGLPDQRLCGDPCEHGLHSSPVPSFGLLGLGNHSREVSPRDLQVCRRTGIARRQIDSGERER